jgi:putative aldouronate transport system substrate-binding protein
MKKSSKKRIALLAGLALLMSLAACGTSDSPAAATTASDSHAAATTASDSPAAATTVSDKPNDSSEPAPAGVQKVAVAMPTIFDLFDAPEVQAAINAITSEKYGIEYEITFIPIGNWAQQSNLLLTGSDVDIIAVFGTPLSSFVKNGQLAPLSDYYESAPAEFRTVWLPEEIVGTAVNGTVYAIPNLRNFGNYFGLNIDEEIAAEFSIANGQKLTMNEIDAFLRAAQAKYPDRYALAPVGITLIGGWSWDGLGEDRYVGVLADCGQSTTVENVFNTDDFLDFCAWARAWYLDGLVTQDILSNNEAWQTLISSKKAISVFDNYGVDTVPGMIRTVVLEPWVPSNSYTALCYGININSGVKDAAWKALEIFYTDREVGILFNNGIEGKHYVKNDNGTISYPEGKNAADVGYGMASASWISPYAANSYPLDSNGPTFFEDLVDFNRNTSLKSKAFGLTFDPSEVMDEFTACINVMNKYYGTLMAGAVDIESTIEQANKELEAAGIKDVIAAKQAQLDAFLAAK